MPAHRNTKIWWPEQHRPQKVSVGPSRSTVTWQLWKANERIRITCRKDCFTWLCTYCCVSGFSLCYFSCVFFPKIAKRQCLKLAQVLFVFCYAEVEKSIHFEVGTHCFELWLPWLVKLLGFDGSLHGLTEKWACGLTEKAQSWRLTSLVQSPVRFSDIWLECYQSCWL